MIAIVVMLVGICFVAILTAAGAERFTRAQRQAERERDDISSQLDAISKRLEAIERQRS